MKVGFRLLLVTLLLALQAEALAAQVQGIRTSSSATKVRIVLDCDSPVAYKDTSAGLAVNLELAGGAKNLPAVKLTDRVLQKVQLVQDGKEKSHLLVNLSKQAQHQVLVLKHPDRIVLDVYRIAIIRQHDNLGKGLAYNFWQDDLNGRPLRFYFLELAPQSGYEVRPFSAAISGTGRGRLSRAAVQTGAKAVVNACYFDTDGWVIGNCKADGNWIGADGDYARSALVIDKDGHPSVQKGLQYKGTVALPNGNVLQIRGMNRERIAGDLVLYNRNYGPSTGTNAFGREVKLVQGRVTEVDTKGNMRLEAGSVVLSGHGANADALAPLKKGDRVNLVQTLGNATADAAPVVASAGPSLLTDGKPDVRSEAEQIAGDIAWGRSPRTAVGIRPDGTMLILVADGRSTASAGLTLNELARYLQKLGAVQAVNFDGGGSSEMVLNGRIVNRPSDGAERPVSIALGVFTK